MHVAVYFFCICWLILQCKLSRATRSACFLHEKAQYVKDNLWGICKMLRLCVHSHFMRQHEEESPVRSARGRDLVLMDEPQPLLAEIGERERDGWCPCSLDSTLIYGEYPGLKLNPRLRAEKSLCCRHGVFFVRLHRFHSHAAVSLDGNITASKSIYYCTAILTQI